MRQVFKPDMVSHLWANQSQDSARSNGSFYFVGDTIYSYGSHFPIARHVTHKGRYAVLFTTRNHSVTTAKHKSIVLSACRHLQVFHVENVNETHHKEQIADYHKRYNSLIVDYGKSRGRKAFISSQLTELIEEANTYAEFFGLKTRLFLPNDMQAECERIQERDREKQRKRKAKQERERIQHDKEILEKVDKWATGETDYISMTFENAPIRLRVKDNLLQTSLGAQVPLDHAIKAFRILKRLRNQGETYQRNGHTIHLGHFALDSFENDTVKAGCHRVAWDEIERVATLAGVN